MGGYVLITLTLRTYTEAGLDDFGNPVRTWVERPWIVTGMAPGAIQDPMQPNREASIVAWTVYAEKSATPPTDADQVLVDGAWLPVNGRPADWTRGPYGVDPGGLVVELRRADG